MKTLHDTVIDADPDDMNNERAEDALRAVIHFQQITQNDEEPIETVLQDLLTNLVHLCARDGYQLRTLLFSACEHYKAETNGFGAQFDGIYFAEEGGAKS